MKKISIVKNFKYFAIISFLLVVGSIITFINNIRRSIEFTGGIKLELNKALQINTSELENQIKNIKVSSQVLNGETQLEIRSNQNKQLSSNTLNQIKNYLKERNYIKGNQDIVSVSFIGPTIGEYMKKSAKYALSRGIFIMAIYILIAFAGVRQNIKPWIFALVTVVTLMHDVIMAAGAYGIWMYLNPSVVVNSVFIIAILTVLGYSVNDTIIIFDRIRENLQKYKSSIEKGQKKLYEIFDESLYQTMRRSIFTSLSTIIVVLAMFMFGNNILKDFSFVILAGVIFGTYSSIFLAAPGVYRINRLITGKE